MGPYKTPKAGTRENPNARGLYDSGIELELENRLQKGSASDQAMILNDRLTKLQQQLQAGLTTIGAQRFQTMDQYGLAGANAQTAADAQGRTLAQQREQQAVQDMLSLRGQVSGEDTAAQALGRQTPQEVYDAKLKARPAAAPATHFRIRYDKVDGHGSLTLRYDSKLHHIGMGARHRNRAVVMLIADRDIRVVTVEDGELLRHLTLDPRRDCQWQSA